MGDGIGLTEALLGLDGFRVLGVTENPDELVIAIESTATVEGCASCGVRAEAHDRMPIAIWDLACFGRPARLVWHKRRWRCREDACDAKTWTEHSDHVDAQVVLTRRAGAEACRQVGENARPVAGLARELGVCWSTVMNAVIEHGTPLVDDPERVGVVAQLGVDETSFLKANREHPTMYATGLVDLEARIVIDMVEGNAAVDLRRWCSTADPGWLAGIEVAESSRVGLPPHLDHATRVADPFHVVPVANRCLDKVRRRTQNETLGRRGRKADPLYRIRKLLLTRSERLDERGTDGLLLGLRAGDPHDEILGTWARQRIGARRLPRRQPRRRCRVDRQSHRRLCSRRRRQDRLARQHTPIVAHRDPRPPRHRRVQRPHRRSEPLRQESETLRPRVPVLRQLSTPRAAPHRWRHLADTTPTTAHPHPCSPLKRLEPATVRS